MAAEMQFRISRTRIYVSVNKEKIAKNASFEYVKILENCQFLLKLIQNIR